MSAPIPFPNTPAIRDLIARELAVDLGHGDLSTAAFPQWRDQHTRAKLIAKAEGLLAGVEAIDLVWELVGARAESTLALTSGQRVTPGLLVAYYEGTAALLLAGERTALNLVSHLSGIATLTARYVAACVGTSARIADTRKTLPGLRTLQKYAVRVGGGVNHRFALDDAVMLKDNHLVLAGSIAYAVHSARANLGPTVKVEVEVNTVAQCVEALKAGADVIMLDNMDLATVAECVALRKPGVVLEASGGLSLEDIPALAATGVDYISVGRLTHSVPALDLSLDF